MKIQESIKLGIEFWNDSCDLEHLAEAVQTGAVGATCNPVIVFNAILRQKGMWLKVAQDFMKENPEAIESEIAWFLVQYAGKKASELLLPVYEKTEGKKGRISLQVNPYFYKSYEYMLKQGQELADLAPNVTVKVPATDTGIRVMEELSALGISVNATVSFSVSQAIESAEAIERGLERACKEGKLKSGLQSYVTIMVGRIEDFVRSEIQSQKQISVNPISPLWSGIAVFKEAHRIFEKKSYRASLLSAAYRHSMHWSELIGEGVVQSIPYEWWKRFDKSRVSVNETLRKPVSEEFLNDLNQIPSFEKLIKSNLQRKDFVHLTPSKNTLLQFLNGQDELTKFIRDSLLPS